MNVGFSLKRALHRVLRKHFQPSIYRDVWAEKYITRTTKEKGYVVAFGYRRPNRRAKKLIKQVPLLSSIIRFRKALPPTYDLRNVNGTDYTAPVSNQGAEGACTGFGAYGMKGSQERLSDTFDEDKSQRMIYNDARNRGGLLDSEGAYMIDVMQALVEDGVCRSHYWPYEANHDNSWPPPNPDAAIDARNWQVGWFADCAKEEDPIEAIKQAIFQLGAVDVGTPWPKSWELPWNGDCPLPDANEEILGGHSWVIIGWDDLKGRFIARNSWGSYWGNQGDFTFPYESLRVFAENMGGYEAYKAQDSTSIPCPEGQHYDGTNCVPDGENPNPPEPNDCKKQFMTCITPAMDITDFFKMVVAGVLCIINFWACSFGIKYKMTKKYTGKGKTRKLTLTFQKATK